MWPISNTVTVSHDVAGMLCEESGWHVNIHLLRPFIASIRAHRFASLVVTPWGYKSGSRPCANLRPLTETPIASSSPSLWLKKKERQTDRSRTRG
jgi:hypothetical protein